MTKLQITKDVLLIIVLALVIVVFLPAALLTFFTVIKSMASISGVLTHMSVILGAL